MPDITPCLWFDTEGEDAAKFYTSVFPNSKITNVTHYGSAGPRSEGTVMTVEFELDGKPFVALNGGPQFRFSEALSFQVDCDTQDDVDSLWTTLSDDLGPLWCGRSGDSPAGESGSGAQARSGRLSEHPRDACRVSSVRLVDVSRRRKTESLARSGREPA